MTPAQLATLRFIAFRLDQGVPPTLQEIADRHGVTKVSVHERLRLLRRDGYVTWKRHTKHSLQLTGQGRECLARIVPDERTAAAVREERQAWISMLRNRVIQLRSQAEAWSADGFEEWADECNRNASFIEDLLDAMRRMRPAIGLQGLLDATEPDPSWRTDAIHCVPGLATESGVMDDATRHVLCPDREMGT